MSEALRLLQRAVRHLNRSSVLQRALRTLELWLAQMSRRRGQELHTETAAGGAPSVMVVVRQSEPLTLSDCSVCSTEGADMLGDGENCEGQDFLQNPELMSCSTEECGEDSGWLVAPAREETGALSSQLVTGFDFTSSLPD